MNWTNHNWTTVQCQIDFCSVGFCSVINCLDGTSSVFNWPLSQLCFCSIVICSIIHLFNLLIALLSIVEWFIVQLARFQLTFCLIVFCSIDYCSAGFLLNRFVQFTLFSELLVKWHGRDISYHICRGSRPPMRMTAAPSARGTASAATGRSSASGRWTATSRTGSARRLSTRERPRWSASRTSASAM